MEYWRRTVDFKNTIIVLTSNLGYKEEMFHKKGVGFAPESISLHDVNNAISKHFRPEFINRIDEIIYFNPLDEETCLKLAKKYYKEYCNSIQECVSLDDEDIKKMVKNDNVMRYGARGIRREIKRCLSNKLNDKEEAIIL